MFELFDSGAIELVFWMAVVQVLAATVLLPALCLWRGVVHNVPIEISEGKEPGLREAKLPSVSVIIAAYNEAEHIESKLVNTLALDYPPDRIEIIVASDGSDDETVAIARRFEGDRVRVLDLPRRGKNATLNEAMPLVRHDIVVFTDADSLLDRGSMRHLVAPFADEAVGGVGGDYRYQRKPGEEGGERAYWSYDRWLKMQQTRSGSMTSATGQLFALRRELLCQVPPGVTDDFFLSTQAPAARLRLVFEPRATSWGPIADPGGEFRRKCRLTSRGLRSVWLQRRLLDPFRYGFYAVQLFLHKVLRRTIFIGLPAIWLTAMLLAAEGAFYRWVALGLTLGIAAGAIGVFTAGSSFGRARLLSLPAFFLRWNAATAIAFVNLFRRRAIDTWSANRVDGSNG